MDQTSHDKAEHQWPLFSGKKFKKFFSAAGAVLADTSKAQSEKKTKGVNRERKKKKKKRKVSIELMVQDGL